MVSKSYVIRFTPEYAAGLCRFPQSFFANFASDALKPCGRKAQQVGPLLREKKKKGALNAEQTGMLAEPEKEPLLYLNNLYIALKKNEGPLKEKKYE